MKLLDLLDDIAQNILSWEPGTRLDADIESHIFTPNTVGFFAVQYPVLLPLVDRPPEFLKRLTDLFVDDLFNDPYVNDNASLKLRVWRFAHEANAARVARRKERARVATLERKALARKWNGPKSAKKRLENKKLPDAKKTYTEIALAKAEEQFRAAHPRRKPKPAELARLCQLHGWIAATGPNVSRKLQSLGRRAKKPKPARG